MICVMLLLRKGTPTPAAGVSLKVSSAGALSPWLIQTGTFSALMPWKERAATDHTEGGGLSLGSLQAKHKKATLREKDTPVSRVATNRPIFSTLRFERVRSEKSSDSESLASRVTSQEPPNPSLHEPMASFNSHGKEEFRVTNVQSPIKTKLARPNLRATTGFLSPLQMSLQRRLILWQPKAGLFVRFNSRKDPSSVPRGKGNLLGAGSQTEKWPPEKTQCVKANASRESSHTDTPNKQLEV